MSTAARQRGSSQTYTRATQSHSHSPVAVASGGVSRRAVIFAQSQVSNHHMHHAKFTIQHTPRHRSTSFIAQRFSRFLVFVGPSSIRTMRGIHEYMQVPADPGVFSLFGEVHLNLNSSVFGFPVNTNRRRGLKITGPRRAQVRSESNRHGNRNRPGCRCPTK